MYVCASRTVQSLRACVRAVAKGNGARADMVAGTPTGNVLVGTGGEILRLHTDMGVGGDMDAS